MTRIDDLSVMRVRLRFREPVRHGRHMLTAQEIGILRITTDDGLTGLGEVSGPALPADLEETVERTRRELVGRDPADIEPVPTDPLDAAVSTAMLDVLGQARGMSIADLLGGGSASVAVNGLLAVGAGSPDTDATNARALIMGGSETLKLKLADGADRAAVADVVAGDPGSGRPGCRSAARPEWRAHGALRHRVAVHPGGDRAGVRGAADPGEPAAWTPWRAFARRSPCRSPPTSR